MKTWFRAAVPGALLLRLQQIYALALQALTPAARSDSPLLTPILLASNQLTADARATA